MDWHEAAIAREHPRERFDCGSAPLNDYLKRYARQNHESGLTRTWVAVDPGGRILGYYSITLAELAATSAAPLLRRRVPHYPIPVYRLARLAVDRSVQGQGLGGELLFAAALRAKAAAESVGGIGLLIDAKDEAAARWYERFGAQRLVDHPLTLVLTFDAIDVALREAGDPRT